MVSHVIPSKIKKECYLLRIVLLILGECCSKWLSRYSCQWGRFGGLIMQIHNAQCRKRGKFFVFNFSCLAIKYEFYSHSYTLPQCIFYASNILQEGREWKFEKHRDNHRIWDFLDILTVSWNPVFTALFLKDASIEIIFIMYL